MTIGESFKGTFLALFVFFLFRYIFIFSDFPPNAISEANELQLKGSTVGVHTQKFFDGKLEAKCLSHDDMTQIIDRAPMVNLIAPAKAAGSSLIEFMRECSNVDIWEIIDMDLMRDRFDVPPVISIHVSTAYYFKHIIERRPALTVYSHRSEISRMKSAATHVLKTYIPQTENPLITKEIEELKEEHHIEVYVNETGVIITDEGMINLIKSKYMEMGYTDSNILNCGAFDHIYKVSPELVVMNFIQANKMQDLVADKFCPDIRAKKTNVEKHETVIVKVLKDNSEYPLKDWLDAKENILEWYLGLNDNIDCLGNIKAMENALFSCPTQLIQILPSYE